MSTEYTSAQNFNCLVISCAECLIWKGTWKPLGPFPFISQMMGLKPRDRCTCKLYSQLSTKPEPGLCLHITIIVQDQPPMTPLKGVLFTPQG